MQDREPQDRDEKVPEMTEQEKKEQAKRDRTLGILAVIGGFLWQFLLGAIFIWGNIAPYVTSYLRQSDESITIASTFYVLAIQIMTGGCLMYPGTVIALRYHPRITMIIALLIGCGGIFIGSIVTNYYLFVLSYGVCFGVSYALSFSTPLVVAWSYFNRHYRARVSGIISAGFGFSSAVFNIITLKLVNPDNIQPDIAIEEDKITFHYYSDEIANNSPIMLRWVVVILVCLGVVAIALTPNFKNRDRDAPEPGNPESLGEIFRERSIYLIMISGFFVSSTSMYFLSAFKIYGINEGGIDDEFLSYVATIANFFNGPCRILWGILLDKIGFKTTVSILFIIQIFLMIFVDYIVNMRYVYCLFIIVVMICQGAVMTLFGGVSAQLYGPAWGGKIVSIFIAMVGLSGIVIGAVQQALITQVGYFGLFLILAGCSLVGLVIILVGYSDNNLWLSRKRKASMAALKETLLDKEEREKADQINQYVNETSFSTS